MEDIARFFPTPDDADEAFAIFDKDSNGDASREEVEMACSYVIFHGSSLIICPLPFFFLAFEAVYMASPREVR